MRIYEEDHSEIGTIESINSAKEVVPFIMELIQPRRVIDVGCGLGGWLSVFKQYGVEEIRGIDGDYVNLERLRIPVESFLAHDLTKPLTVESVFDLVVSLEVAEHLPAESAESFIDLLVNLGPAILFSAAIPYQPGDWHHNCQWPSYWAELFFRKGYTLFDCLRMKFWQNRNVNWWYSQNMLLFIKQSCLLDYPILKERFHPTSSTPFSIVHPELYQLQHAIYQRSKEPSVSTKSTLTRRLHNMFKNL